MKKNPFKIGDLVKLRPDVLARHNKRIPARTGFSKTDVQWRETLEKLQNKTGKIVRVSPNSGYVNVEYPESWASKDEFGKSYTVNTIGIDYTELIPSEKPVAEGVGWGSTKDMAKDPKHISGERWRIKFQSSGDIKKHGTTEKSSVSENLKVSDIKEVIQDLIKEMWIGWEEEEEGKVDEGDKAQHITINIVDKVKQKKADEVKKKALKELESPEKNYIIWAKSGPATVYFVDSPSQGPRMVQNAQSMATRFPTEETVRNKIIELKKKYPGILKWDFKIVGPKSWESVWQSHGPKEFQLGHQVFKPVKKDDEYVVRWTIDGKRNEGRTYYTDDKKDAYDTYDLMVKQAVELNKKIHNA